MTGRLLTLALILMTSSATQADFLIHSATNLSCPMLMGNWTGSGKVSNWAVDCSYRGSATVHSMDQSGNFIFDITVDKTGGSFVCPNHSSKSLAGSCQDGRIVFKTNYGHLTGNVSGDAGYAEGTLTISPGISADVKINIQRG